MTIDQCNPFVRRAKEFSLLHSYIKAYSVDCRLIYFTKGEGSVEFNHTTYPVFKDTALLFQSGTMYQIQTNNFISYIPINFDYTQNFTYRTVAFKMQKEESEHKIQPLENVEFTDFPILNQVLYIPNAEFIFSDVHKIVSEKQELKIGHQAYCSSIMKKIICKILRSSNAFSNSADEKTERILSYIHKNYATDINNEEIASQINYHPYYVNKLFYSYTGMTIHQYLNHYRLTMAAHFLSTGSEPINQICYAVGFQSPAHFAMNFKKKFGISPKDYRNMYHED
ncbi:MAG: helix-turn-helix transcriptional regulator [Tyzzerella sp.]|nr:helix-turn-helix transcriptional regulator [Tyzzerella sp.]